MTMRPVTSVLLLTTILLLLNAPAPAQPADDAPALTQETLAARERDRLPRDTLAALERRLGAGLPVLPGDAGLIGTDEMPDLAGKVVVVMNWRRAAGTRQFAATIEQAEAAHPGEVVVIGIAQELDADRLAAMFSRQPAPGPILADPEGTLAAQFGFDTRTTTVVVDRNGAIRFVGVRAPAGLERVLAMLVAEEADPSVRAGRSVADIARGEQEAAAQAEALEEAWSTRDGAAIDAAMERMWTVDRAKAIETSYGLMTSRSAFDRPVGVEQFLRHADAEETVNAIAGLSRPLRAVEGRMLLRTLGKKLAKSDLSPAERVAVLEPFLRDSDRSLQLAAVQAIGDVDAPEGVEKLIPLMRASAPVVEENWGGGDNDRINMAAFGAAAAITGIQASQIVTYRDWFEAWQRDPDSLADIEVSLREREGEWVTGGDDPVNSNETLRREVRIFGQSRRQWTRSGDFWIRLSTGSISDQDRSQGRRSPADIPATGPLGIDSLTRMGADGQRAALSSTSTVFFAPHLPLIKLTYADDATFSSFASTSFMGGEAQGNEIVLRLADSIVMEHVMAHEWVHILQSLEYEAGRFPRWLLEGYAESATRSTRSPHWTLDRLTQRDLNEPIQRGLLTRIVSWGRGASSGPQDGENYALSHLFVDFLRFGNFPAAETRLAMLHASIDARRPDRQALQDLYGMSPQELDRAVIEWLSETD